EKNKNVEQFNSTGQEVSLTHPTGLGWTFTYTTAGGLAGVTSIDGGSSTFSYNSTTGLLNSITDPAARTLWLTDTNTDLTGITDVDGSTRTMTYSTPSSHLLAFDNWAPWQTSFSYNSKGQVNTVNLGGAQPYTIVPANGSGVATVTDGNGNTT